VVGDAGALRVHGERLPVRERFPSGALAFADQDVVCSWLRHETTRPLGRVSNGRLNIENGARALDWHVEPNANLSYQGNLRTLVDDKTVKGASFTFALPERELGFLLKSGNVVKAYPGRGKAVALVRTIHHAILKEVCPVMMLASLGSYLVETRAALSGQVAMGEARKWLEGLGVGAEVLAPEPVVPVVPDGPDPFEDVLRRRVGVLGLGGR